MNRPFALSACIVLVGCGVLGGCDPAPLATGEPDRLAARRMLSEEGAVDGDGKDKEIDECKPTTTTTTTTTATTTATTTTTPNATTCYWKTKSLIDYRYEHYKTNLLHAVDTGDLAGDVLALGLTTASTITPGATAARLFSALASAVLGVKSFVNEDVLQKQGITLIISEMDSDRTQLATVDAQHLQGSNYTVAVALNDLFAYYEAGTFQHAITSLQAKASQPAGTATAAAYTAQEVVTILPPPAGGTTFNPGLVFGISGTIGGGQVSPTFSSPNRVTPADVAQGLQKAAAFGLARITPVASGNTLTFTYSTTQSVVWQPTESGAAFIQVSPQTMVPPIAGH